MDERKYHGWKKIPQLLYPKNTDSKVDTMNIWRLTFESSQKDFR
jgi:hypothetical protein